MSGEREWVLVPREPTPDMRGAMELAFLKAKGWASHRAVPTIWAAMLSASPAIDGGDSSSAISQSAATRDPTRAAGEAEPSAPENCAFVPWRQGMPSPPTCERCGSGPCPFYNNDATDKTLRGAS